MRRDAVAGPSVLANPHPAVRAADAVWPLCRTRLANPGSSRDRVERRVCAGTGPRHGLDGTADLRLHLSGEFLVLPPYSGRSPQFPPHRVSALGGGFGVGREQEPPPAAVDNGGTAAGDH